MAYAVVYFIDDELTSEVPTNWLHKGKSDFMCWWPPSNTKNIKTLIIKRAEPARFITTWLLLRVHVEKYCDTFEKARKVAEDEYYTSAEDTQLGKGHRKKYPPNRYINTISSSDSDEGDNENNKIKTHSQSVNVKYKKKYNKDTHTIDIQEHNDNTIIESCTSKLPEWPSSCTVNSKNENIVPTGCKQDGIIIFENIGAKNQCGLDELYDDNHNKDLQKCVEDIKGNTETLIRMYASLDLQMKDILHHINKLTPNMRFNASTERVKNLLPIKSIDEIKTLEELLKEESFLKEYKTFILKIGDHSPKETVRNVLSRVFSNECSIKCSWKGRRQNFGMAKLTLVNIIKEIILEQHTLTERELDDFMAEWFRFGKQRFHRANNLQDQN